MPEDPLLTRQTLLIRLRDSADHASWAEFSEIYTPLIYGYCLKREIRHADASDIVQEVMRSVSLAMKRFQYDPEKGAFKSWLLTALRRAIAYHFHKQARRPSPASGTQLNLLFDAEASAGQPEVDRWEEDYRRRLLAWAMDQVRPEFGDRAWTAFEQTAIQGRSNDEVAAELGMRNNALAVARHRIIKRIRTRAQTVDPEDWEDDLMKKTSNS